MAQGLVVFRHQDQAAIAYRIDMGWQGKDGTIVVLRHGRCFGGSTTGGDRDGMEQAPPRQRAETKLLDQRHQAVFVLGPAGTEHGVVRQVLVQEGAHVDVGQTLMTLVDTTARANHEAVRQRYLAAMSHGLTAYDAAYLELALQRRCQLATLDSRLAEAALAWAPKPPATFSNGGPR